MADAIGDQDAVEAVVGLHDKGWIGVLGRLGGLGIGHGDIIGEEGWGAEG